MVEVMTNIVGDYKGNQKKDCRYLSTNLFLVVEKKNNPKPMIYR